MNRLRLLVTRKIARSLVLQAGLNGIDVLEKEFIKTEPVDVADLGKLVTKILSEKATVVFTSKNAASALGSNFDVKRADWKIFCLESATSDEVEKTFGRDKIVGTAINAQLLSRVIIENAPDKKIVLFCGNLRRDDLPQNLQAAGFDVHEIVVYNTVLVPQRIVDDYEAVAFFSPSGVKSFFSANKLKDGVICLSVGRTTTEAIKEFTKNKIVTASRPSEESVFDLAQEIKNNS